MRRLALIIVVALVCLRIIGAIAIPLTDTTEARYAEMARKMSESGDWITPQHDYGVPFWGKPPLAIWLSALSVECFGASAWAARLPVLLLSALILFLTVAFGHAHGTPRLLTGWLLLSTPLFFVASGSVMTDIALTAGTTLSMLGFWRALHNEPSRFWGYAFFAGLALGLLAKGPVALAITGLAVLPWLIVERRGRDLWLRLPWLSGIALMLALSLPWYLAAEHNSPGFLNYFIVGEHLKRFLVGGWQGDRYGVAHPQPRGIVWIFALAAAFPWSLYALGPLVRGRKKLRERWGAFDPWRRYLLFWTLAPMLLFTTARNVLWPYVLPALPAFVLLLAGAFSKRHEGGDAESAYTRGRLIASAALPLAAFAGILLFHLAPAGRLARISQIDVLERYRALCGQASCRLTYFHTRYYSAEFYSHGRVRHTYDPRRLKRLLRDETVDFVAVRPPKVPLLLRDLAGKLKVVATFGEHIVLFQERRNSAAEKQAEPRAATRSLQKRP